MARDLMPKSGIVMPHIVITRDAAVVGVSTVDGKAGAVTLSGTYAKITDVYKKTETYSQSEVDNLIEPIMQRAMFKDDPYIDNNTALRSGGANGITSIDLIKASTDNSIHIGDLAAGVQGIHLYSEGKIDVAYKDANGDDAVSPLYSQRYRPPTADLPFAVVGTYVTDSKGRTIAVTKDGNNSDIKKLNALTDVKATTVTFEKSPIVPTPVNPTEAATKAYVDAAVQSSGSGGYIGETFWHPSRVELPGGTAPGDGQLISGASTLYPDLVALVQAGKLPNTTETTWQAQPTARAAYVYDSTADTLRMPDLNGIQTGSIAAPVLRGDGGTLDAGSVQQNGAPNIRGVQYRVTATAQVQRYTGNVDGAFYLLPRETTSPPTEAATSGANSQGVPLGFNANLYSNAYRDDVTEVRMNSIVGCYIIRVATAAQNGGDVDMLELQAQVEELRTAAVSTNNNVGYALLNVPGTPALGSRTVLVNPFGMNTPVICLTEIFHATLQKWVTTPNTYNASADVSYGILSSYSEGEGIVVKCGNNSFVAASQRSLSSQDFTNNYTTPSPIRVHVWSIGKDISKLKQISQIDPVLIQEFKAPTLPTGLRYIWTRNGTETGGTSTYLTLSESVLGKTIYLGNNANYSSSGIVIPRVKPPHLTALTAPSGVAATSWEIFMNVTDSIGYRIQIDEAGTKLYISAITSGATPLSWIYVDDYSVQP